jgi:hypothetical protein
MREPLRLSFAIAATVMVLWVDVSTLGRVLTQGYAGDWTVLWAAAQTARPYGDLEQLPFAYPPSAHLLLRGLGNLPFFSSLVLWAALGTAALMLAAKRLAGATAAALAVLTPAWLVAALSGQVSLFVGALTVAGVTARSPWFAGLAFASAGMIKPQSLIALPIALVAARDWRVAGATAAAVVGILAGSVLMAGIAPWLKWIEALPLFRDVLAARQLDALGVGANALAIRFDLPLIYSLGVLLGAACTWAAFRRPDPLDRYAALVCGAALISPYMLHYDLAGLGAVAVAMLLDRQRGRLAWVGAALAVSYVLAPLGIVGLALALVRGRPPGSGTAAYFGRWRAPHSGGTPDHPLKLYASERVIPNRGRRWSVCQASYEVRRR